MRRLSLVLLLIVVTLAMGYIFAVSGIVKAGYALPFGWSTTGQCLSSDAGCIPDNTCIAPVATPTQGMPLRYSRANSATCEPESNITAQIADWVIYFIIALLFVYGVIGRLFRTPKGPLYA
jgi:hypothetical protein